ncbi:phage holin family protein [Streptomyces sp. NBC_01218]|uniref:phage holin family protein n=1 Tax=unclassified Streptomyces TaxID=2593676 RepID=UPI0023BA184C|nr:MULTISPECIES: phage holin family protein [unclassified Streptomyces]WEH40690.1 phage holin family protein [Streptomyces sp. AM 2-1-1]WSQ52426.1 phage holin family protein [Streptomyces sp. NBC_01218]
MTTVEYPTGPGGPGAERGPGTGPAGTHDDSVGALVTRASQQLSQLVRDEMRLAQAEMTQKGKRFGLGGGLFGGAATVGFLALGALVTAGIAGLATVMPVWASALIVCAVLAAVAAVLALKGKKEIALATPAKPERAIDNVKADMAEIKEKAHR